MKENTERGYAVSLLDLREKRCQAWGNLGDDKGQNPTIEEITDVLHAEYDLIHHRGESHFSLLDLDDFRRPAAKKFDVSEEGCEAAIDFFSATGDLLELIDGSVAVSSPDFGKVDASEVGRKVVACKGAIRLLRTLHKEFMIKRLQPFLFTQELQTHGLTSIAVSLN